MLIGAAICGCSWPTPAALRAAEPASTHVDDLMRCYTELPDPVRSTADVVTALRERTTRPIRPATQKRRRFGIF